MNAITATQDVNSSRESAPLNFNVSNQLLVNADQTLTLADSYIIVQGQPPRNPPLASNASFQSTVEGGKPPYTYGSSNTGVAIVHTDGKVVAANLGSAKITVTDSERRTASYTITFKGTQFKSVVLNPGVIWSSDVNDRNRPQYHALNLAQMQSFWDQYKNDDPNRSVPAILGWPTTNYWTAVNAEGNNARALNFSALVPDFSGVLTNGGTKLPTASKVQW